MVQHKAQLKKQQKQQKRGVDFKKIKRKIGRKLPPPKNTTNTEVKSKAIILPEQSLVSEKGGLAVSNKGLTLKELLQQTSHHNAKVRRGALVGIRDIFNNHQAELKMHRLSVIEKLRERMSDEDTIVRDKLYQLLKEVIFPACKEDNQGTFISLMMAYVFNAMTHLAFDVRLMAFKFFDLVVQHYPLSFSMYAEKIIQHYKEILQKNQFNLHDKGKLKSVVAGLAYCLSLLPCSDDNSSTKNVVADPRVLHGFECQVHEDGSVVTAKELMGLLPILVGGVQDFMPSIQTQSFDCVFSILKSIHLVVKFFVYGKGKASRRDEDVLQMLLKKLFAVFPLTGTHQSSDKEENRYFMLNVIVAEMFFSLIDWSAPPSAFVEKFLVFILDALSDKVCGSGKTYFQKHSLALISYIPKLVMHVDHTWKSHILEAFTEVFKKCDPECSMKLVCLSAIEEMLLSKKMVEFEITWIKEIPLLLSQLGDKNPSSSKAVLGVQLRLGQRGLLELDRSMQESLREFYSTCDDGGGGIRYGPFVKLTRENQELSLCCLYYLSPLHPSLLQSVAACCFCEDVDPFRVLEVVSCAYTAGHVEIADYISFLITLLSHEKSKSVTRAVCSCLSQIGDHHLVFQMLEGPLIHHISNNKQVPLENTCALLRMMMTLDSNPTRLSQHSCSILANLVPQYLINLVSNVPEEDSRMRRYYMLPCLVLFGRSGGRMLKDVLKVMASLLICSSATATITALVDVLLLLLLHRPQDGHILLSSSCKQEIDTILRNIRTLMSDEGACNLKIEEKHKIQSAFKMLTHS